MANTRYLITSHKTIKCETVIIASNLEEATMLYNSGSYEPSAETESEILDEEIVSIDEF